MTGVQQHGRYLSQLSARSAETGTVLCLGIDPHPAMLPAEFRRDLRGVERFARLLVDCAAPAASAVKFNVAFFEAFGSAGIAALERVRARIPAQLPVILDGKRGDVPSTTERIAVALFDALGADAITANAYLGAEAVEPLLEREDRFVYLLCRTSNPGAREVQELPVSGDGGVDDARETAPAEPLFLRIARLARDWGARYRTVGLVVGATAPAELVRVRQAAPELPFLVPGVGAQRGEVEAAVANAGASGGLPAALTGGGGLVNVSRDIAARARDAADPEAALVAAAQEWAARIPVLR